MGRFLEKKEYLEQILLLGLMGGLDYLVAYRDKIPLRDR